MSRRCQLAPDAQSLYFFCCCSSSLAKILSISLRLAAMRSSRRLRASFTFVRRASAWSLFDTCTKHLIYRFASTRLHQMPIWLHVYVKLTSKVLHKIYIHSYMYFMQDFWLYIQYSYHIYMYISLKEVAENQLSGMALDCRDRWILPFSVARGRGAKVAQARAKIRTRVYRKSDNQTNALPTEPTVTPFLHFAFPFCRLHFVLARRWIVFLKCN